MSARAIRSIRSEANKAVSAVAPAIQTALQNEQVTRQRVDMIEAVLARGLWGRLKWLCLGR